MFTTTDLYLEELGLELQDRMDTPEAVRNNWNGVDVLQSGDRVRVCATESFNSTTHGPAESDWGAGASVYVFLAANPHVVAASATVTGLGPVELAELAVTLWKGARR